MYRRSILLIALLACCSCLVVVDRPRSRPRPPSQSEEEPKGDSDRVAFSVDARPERQRYVSYRAEKPVTIDGRLDEEAWLSAPSTAAFVDIEGGQMPPPRLATSAKMLWDEDYFYLAAELEEPHLWATLTQRDSIIFYDNDFELFIDPDGDTQDYYELEINALGTEWDLLLERPYRDGGTALHAFDTPGLLSAVSLNGSLNDASDLDSGWSVEIAIPWSALEPIAGRQVPPADGDVWWVNFSRVEWELDIDPKGAYSKRVDEDGKPLPEHNWVWSPQGVIAMHEPESWGLVMFASAASTEYESESPRPFVDPADLEQRAFLMAVYRAQKRFHERYGRFADRPAQLGIEGGGPGAGVLQLFSTPSGFEALLHWRDDSQQQVLHIDEQGHLW